MNRAAKFGVPLVFFCVAGLYGLQQFVGQKYERMDKQVRSMSERRFELQEEHKKLMERFGSDDFELKPLPPAPDDDGDDDDDEDD
ncbi:hypothetical protein FNF27_03016 [Cafeteria roenbergensis]|uniref:Cytochrome c oxidase assembly protein COX16 homolog, mitochondrial n=1 Tax=Cafeteria roenbergensis TaxID=33653 RepID=A0A5A8CP47_CAFRO|nr:hypothetical protein FNF29_02053 [Cafeteria roenbergensis]KAA0165118.1 hypothetical protein FNF31_02134 [Cafeteria roenbergensis]KAA0170217.1 hypothetical protein FNF28_01639 [Cafeteria roenbergensis]KAA0175603.1 hypothetical protein FNF27_03016 [Cafeteria roenbergensis]|eukprot:KAA0154912.1 hypothetical protein FNF29_02053 [Cafeteria roenbergensis]